MKLGSLLSPRWIVRFVAVVAALLIAIWFFTGPGDARMSGLSPVAPRTQSQPLFRVRVSGKYGYIDRNGNVVIQPRFGHCGGFSEGLAWASEAGVGEGAYGFVDEQGQWVISPKFQMAFAFSEGLAAVRNSAQGPWGYVDQRGEWIMLPQFEAANGFSGGRAQVGRMTLIGRGKSYLDASGAEDWKWREIDRQGHHLGRVSQSYDRDFSSEGLKPCWVGKLVGFADRTGAMVIPAQFEHTTGFSEGVAAVQVPGGQWGYIDAKGGWAIPVQFGWSNPFENGLAEVVVNRKAGYIDHLGNWVWKPSE